MFQNSYELFFQIVAFVYGLVIGSFLNVCIHRVPRSRFMADEQFLCPHCQGAITEFPCPLCGQVITDDVEPILPSKSMGGVRSQCPHCGAVIRAYDNIPVLSYIFLRGKCRACKAPISARYPVVELLSAFLAFACAVRFGVTWTAGVYYVLIACLLVVSFIDVDVQRIPKFITYPAMIAGLAASSWLTGLGLKESLYGMLCGGGGLYLLHETYWLIRKREGMGLGDADLMAMLGTFIGVNGVLFTLMAGAFIGAILGVLMTVAGQGGMKRRLPFGPFLAMGAILYLFWGESIISWYMNLYR